jgi:hypothetical protein
MGVRYQHPPCSVSVCERFKHEGQMMFEMRDKMTVYRRIGSGNGSSTEVHYQHPPHGVSGREGFKRKGHMCV